MEENQVLEPVPEMDGYKKIPTFKLWVANQFPYIETDFDAITNYELLQAVVKYLNTVIENENNVESNVTALYNAFVNLHDYVETFFDTLDVQDEVNTKLDEMVEDGTLESLLLNYTQVTKVFDTYNDMVFDTSTFVNGMKLKTLGYHYINDGGGADYIVTNVQNANKYQVSIGTNLWIEMILKGTIYPEQFGAYGNGTNDDTQAIQTALNFGFTHKLNVNFINKYLVTSQTLSDSTKVCLTIQETSRSHMLYENSFQINFIGEAKLFTNEEEETTLLRIDAGNIKFNNLHLSGVVHYTTLIELSRGIKTDTSKTSFSSHNIFSNLRLTNAKLGINIEGGCYYNIFENITYRGMDNGVIIGFTYAEKQGLLAEDSCNRNTFVNMKFGGITENGIRIEYGDTNKFVNINFEGVKNPIYIDDPYKHQSDFPIAPIHISNDNMFVNITMEATTGKNIYNNADGTKFINCSSRFIREDWIIKPQTYIGGGVDNAYTAEKFGNFYKVTGTATNKPYQNAPSYSTLLTDSGLVSQTVLDFLYNDGDVNALKRQSFNFVLKDDSHVDTDVGIEYSGNRFVKSIGGIVHLSAKFKFKATSNATSIKLYFDKDWINNANGNYANTIDANRIPIIISINGTQKLGICKLAYNNNDKNHLVISALDGTQFDSTTDSNIIYLNFSMFRDNNYNLL